MREISPLPISLPLITALIPFLMRANAGLTKGALFRHKTISLLAILSKARLYGNVCSCPSSAQSAACKGICGNLSLTRLTTHLGFRYVIDNGKVSALSDSMRLGIAWTSAPLNPYKDWYLSPQATILVSS